jgi:predicted small metal-binding protein
MKMTKEKQVDILSDKHAERIVKLNDILTNCVINEEFEAAADVRDEIAETILATTQHLHNLTGIKIEDIEQALIQNNTYVFKTLSEKKQNKKK